MESPVYELSIENAELRRDKMRLDWLESALANSSYFPLAARFKCERWGAIRICKPNEEGSFDGVREAIDAAMAETQGRSLARLPVAIRRHYGDSGRQGKAPPSTG